MLGPPKHSPGSAVATTSNLHVDARLSAALWATDRDEPALEVDLGDRTVEDAEHDDGRVADENLAHPMGVALRAEKHLPT